jgi:DHA1 family multidrug resistance protein-like MFS transporter
VDARRRGIGVLLANNALMSAGFYLLIPLLSVHLTRDAGFSATVAGAVLAVRQFSQQGLMLFGGAIADRAGYRPVIVLGLFVRAAGFMAFAAGDHLAVVLGAAVVAGLGGALFEATGKAALAALAPPADRPRLFSLSALVGGVGTAVGPVLGTLLLPYPFAWIGVVAGTFFLVAAALSALLLPSLADEGRERPPSLGETLRTVGHDRAFLLFTALLGGYWFLHNQIYISVPLRAVQVTGGAAIVGLLYTVFAVAGLALQYPLIRIASAYLAPAMVVGLGVAMMGLGLGLMAFAGAPGALGLTAMLVSAVVFAAGRALAEPAKDVVTAAMAPQESLACYFGVAFLALAFGGSAGNYVGGWLFDLATATGASALPWVLFAVLGLAGGAALAGFSRRGRQTSPVPPGPAAAARGIP